MVKQKGGEVNLEIKEIEQNGANTTSQAAENTVKNQQLEAEKQIEMSKQSGGAEEKIEINTTGNDADKNQQQDLIALTLKAQADAEYDKNATLGGRRRKRRKTRGKKSKRKSKKLRKSRKSRKRRKSKSRRKSKRRK